MTKDARLILHSFRTTEAEDAVIQEKMAAFGIQKKSAFFRTMILNGYLLKLELPEIREALRLLKNLTNNVNQIARRLHEQGSIYETEIDDIRQTLDRNWDIFRRMLARLEQPGQSNT